MPLCCYDADAAALRSPGPYTARPAKDGDETWPFWYVTNDGRTNVLTFPGNGGAVLTSRNVAEAVATKFNSKP